MDTTAYIALSRQMALENQMSVVANNIANMNTAGFKGEALRFEQYLIDTDRSEDVSFVVDHGTLRDLTDGPITTTGNALDVAISGDAFFAVETEKGERYTRDGHFQVSPFGELATSNGHLVLDNAGGAIPIPPNAGIISIAADGTISNQDGVIGRIGLVRFDNNQALEREGSSLFRTDQGPLPIEEAFVVQGAIEGSNVQGVLEMTKMMQTVRAFQNTQKMIEIGHELERQNIQESFA